MKKWFVIVTLLTVAALALPANAGVYFCTGTVTSLEISSCCGGVVYVTGVGGLDVVAVCALNGSAGQFNADSCKSAYAALLAAKLTGETVSIGFSDNLTCSTQPAGGSINNTSAWAVTSQ